MTLGDKIISLRKQQGWSQEDLAEQLEISRQSVSKWESAASIPELDKIIKMSEIFHVSTDYLLKEEMEEPEKENIMDMQSWELKKKKKIQNVSLEEAENFMHLTKEVSPKIAFAVVLCILSPVCLILFSGFSEFGFLGVTMTENMAAGLGITILLIFVAIAVVIFIIYGTKLSKYEYLEKECFTLQQGVERMVEERKKEFETRFRYSISAGVVLCILGVIPLILGAIVGANEMICIFCVIILLLLVACAVFLFVSSGSIYGSYEKLLQIAAYTLNNKQLNKSLPSFSGAYWCFITALYLGISFYFENWGRTWIIWPVAGVVFAAIFIIYRNRKYVD